MRSECTVSVHKEGERAHAGASVSPSTLLQLRGSTTAPELPAPQPLAGPTLMPLMPPRGAQDTRPLASSHCPRAGGGSPGGASATAPGSMRMLRRHFLALLPQWRSKRVKEKSGRPWPVATRQSQAAQWQATTCWSRYATPRMSLHETGSCGWGGWVVVGRVGRRVGLRARA